MPRDVDRLRLLTWHVHGNYLYYLSQIPHDIYVPVLPGRPQGYGGRSGTLPWPDNLHEIEASAVQKERFDVVVFQSRKNYEDDQYRILTAAQRRLPRIYIEHDPPRESPTECRHPFQDPEGLLVHVTAFNQLMWDSGVTPSCVIDHGVMVPSSVTYSGELARGLCIVNNLAQRGRRLGADLYQVASRSVPLDLIGMGSRELGGLGEIPYPDLAAFTARYRFLFNPIRYTSLGLSVCEAMMVGVPIVGLATTEMAVTIENGVSGFVYTDMPSCIRAMELLIADPGRARELGAGARRYAQQRFSIERFIADWEAALVLARTLSRTPISGVAS